MRGEDTSAFSAGTRPPYEQWGHLQVHVKHNSSPGAYDGIIKIWRDGTQTADIADYMSRGDCAFADLMYEVNWAR